jgi:hypothetical protein
MEDALDDPDSFFGGHDVYGGVARALVRLPSAASKASYALLGRLPLSRFQATLNHGPLPRPIRHFSDLFFFDSEKKALSLSADRLSSVSLPSFSHGNG